MLEQFEALNSTRKAEWQVVGTYAVMVPILLSTLKSITGKVFTSYRDYDLWWAKSRKEFEVLD